MENNLAKQLNLAIAEEFERRVMHESIPRIKKCLNLLSEEEIWQRPNENIVSVGNLILHLCGNARQWILSGVGKQPDHRDRESEFSEEGPIAREQLMEQLDQLSVEIKKVLHTLSAESLLEKRMVQGFNETVLSMLIHVIEHFSYHTGQITFLTKSFKNIDTQYYAGVNLNAKKK